MKLMEPNFISKEAIAYINNKAIYSWLNNPGFIYQFPKEKNGLDIIHISPVKKLIFIDGDEDTGVTHILQRHRYYTNSFSQSKDGFMKTSRFSKETGGLSEISAIAEMLFDEANLANTKNKFPDLMDVYDKKIPSLNNQKFRLIVYKRTKIVHTLFPVEYNKAPESIKK